MLLLIITKKVFNWILDRKKNISLSLILIPILKVFTHFLLFPSLHKVVVDRIFTRHANHQHKISVFEREEATYREEINEITEMSPLDIGSHFELMFTDRLELFIPVTIIFLIVVWFFNDKIKAR